MSNTLNLRPLRHRRPRFPPWVHHSDTHPTSSSLPQDGSRKTRSLPLAEQRHVIPAQRDRGGGGRDLRRRSMDASMLAYSDRAREVVPHRTAVLESPDPLPQTLVTRTQRAVGETHHVWRQGRLSPGSRVQDTQPQPRARAARGRENGHRSIPSTARLSAPAFPGSASSLQPSTPRPAETGRRSAPQLISPYSLSAKDKSQGVVEAWGASGGGDTPQGIILPPLVPQAMPRLEGAMEVTEHERLDRGALVPSDDLHTFSPPGRARSREVQRQHGASTRPGLDTLQLDVQNRHIHWSPADIVQSHSASRDSLNKDGLQRDSYHRESFLGDPFYCNHHKDNSQENNFKKGSFQKNSFGLDNLHKDSSLRFRQDWETSETDAHPLDTPYDLPTEDSSESCLSISPFPDLDTTFPHLTAKESGLTHFRSPQKKKKKHRRFTTISQQLRRLQKSKEEVKARRRAAEAARAARSKRPPARRSLSPRRMPVEAKSPARPRTFLMSFRYSQEVNQLLQVLEQGPVCAADFRAAFQALPAIDLCDLRRERARLEEKAKDTALESLGKRPSSGGEVLARVLSVEEGSPGLISSHTNWRVPGPAGLHSCRKGWEEEKEEEKEEGDSFSHISGFSLPEDFAGR